MPNRTLLRATLAACGLAAAAAAMARAQAPHPESEPNDDKAGATPVTLAPGDWVTGTSTGDGTGGVPSSADYFLVRTTPLATGIYRHRLTFGPTGNTGMVRGLMQNSGVITTNDEPLQATTAAVRFSQWYGFGREERLYYRVSGTASTTVPYVSTLSTAPVTAVVLSPIPPGSTTITTVGQTGSPGTDTDLWVYDASFNAIPGFGNDDTNLQSSGSTLTRNFPAGTYYLAISSYNLANDQPSPPDDFYGFGPVFDFPDAVLNSDEAAPLNISFRITDSAAGEHAVAATKSGPYEISWFRLDVAVPPVPCYANCDHSTTAPNLTVLDFTCFLQKFAAGDPYANCDGSTTAPTLSFLDFSCFLQKFAAGCSAP